MKKTLLLSLWLVPFLVFGQGITFSPTSIFYTQIQGDNGACIYGDHNHTNAMSYDLNGLITSNANGIFQYRGGTGLMLSNKVTTGNMVFTNGSIILTQPSNTLAPLVINTNWLYLTNGNLGIGTTAGLAKLAISGGLHVGGDSDPGDNNVIIDGKLGIGTTGTPANPLEIHGTHDIYFNPSQAAIGEIPDSVGITGNDNMFFTCSGNGTANKKTVFVYYNTSTWYSAIEFANVASGYTSLLLVKSGGKVGIGTTSPNSSLHVAGPIATGIATGGSCTLSATNSTYLLNVNAGNVTNLTAVGCAGRILTIKAIAPCASGTVYFNGSETLDGASTYSLSASNKFVVYQSDGAGWQQIGGN